MKNEQLYHSEDLSTLKFQYGTIKTNLNKLYAKVAVSSFSVVGSLTGAFITKDFAPLWIMMELVGTLSCAGNLLIIHDRLESKKALKLKINYLEKKR